MEKKTWETPELIVLVRSKPEEAILKGCKLGDMGGNGPGFANNACDNGASCGNCASQITS